jgi:hypothetical protein
MKPGLLVTLSSLHKSHLNVSKYIITKLKNESVSVKAFTFRLGGNT